MNQQLITYLSSSFQNEPLLFDEEAEPKQIVHVSVWGLNTDGTIEEVPSPAFINYSSLFFATVA